MLSDPNARITIFRKTHPQLLMPGALVDESHHIYPCFNGKYGTQKKKWTFPSGASITFSAIADSRDTAGWQGSQLSHILIDEAAEWEMETVLFLLSRLRSATFKGKLQMVMSCNPDRHSFLYEWVKPFLDDDGVPKPGTENIIRWFVVLGGTVYWGDSAEQLYEKYGAGYEFGVDFIPKSFRFIPMSIFDNPILIKNNPEYLANLQAQTRVNRLRFLHGSWSAVVEGSNYFKRGWCHIIDKLPPDKYEYSRGWDLAATKPSESNRNPDWTAGVLLARNKYGHYFVIDSYRFRENTSTVIENIIKTAKNDGLADTSVVIPKDPGQAGAQFNAYLRRILSEYGIYSKSEQVSGHSSKLNKFLPFASLAESGNVSVVKGEWNEAWFDELENFTGVNRAEKNDQVDATATAFNDLAKQTRLPAFIPPDLSRASNIPTL